MFGTPSKMSSSQQKTPKGKGNTLFNYFSKTQNSSQKSSSSQTSPATSAKRNVSASPNLAARATPTQGSASKPAAEVNLKNGYMVGDLVMAQVEGHPFWPGVVIAEEQEPKKKAVANRQFKVLFLGEHSHAWVVSRKLRAFGASTSQGKGGLATSVPKAAGLDEAMEEADKLAPVPLEKRMSTFDQDVLDKALAEDAGSNEEMEVSDDDDEDKAKKVARPKAVIADGSSDEEMRVVRVTTSSRPTRRAASESAAKRRRAVIQSDSDESDGYVPAAKGESSDDNASEMSEAEDEASMLDDIDPDELFDDEECEAEKPKPSLKRKHPPAAKAPQKSNVTPSGRAAVSRTSGIAKTPVTPSATCPLSQGLLTPRSGMSTPSGHSSMNAFSAMSAASSLAKFQSPALTASPAPVSSEGGADVGIVYTHETLDWLREDKIKDATGHLKSHPDYDPRTLHVPREFLSKQSPAMQQWWRMKIDNYDTILFFKVGKFYELYHMDAVTGIKELGLVAMKGAHCHSGFPEIGYGRYSDQLVQKGYRVARVEQTETPLMLEERNRKDCSKDKTVRREICAIITLGTRIYNVMDADTSAESANSFLLALTEKQSAENAGIPQYGVCFIDTTIGCFHIGQFTDDRQSSRLRTLIAHCPPVQVLFPRGTLTPNTQTILNSCLANAMRDCIAPGTEFWTASRTLKTLSESSFFRSSTTNSSEVDEDDSSSSQWPATLQQMVSSNDALGLSAGADHELAISSLGALVWYLKKCGIAGDMLSMRQMQEYIPEDCSSQDRLSKGSSKNNGSSSGGVSGSQQPSFLSHQRHMVLDGVTLLNLEVLQNATDGSVSGSLYQRLDHCSTPFGRRLLKQWICSPLCHPDAINARLDAIQALMEAPGVMANARDAFKQLPDLQRLLGKIHLLGSIHRSSDDHPDSRAIMYEETTYSKRKIQDFLATLTGFVRANDAMAAVSKGIGDCSSSLLRSTVCTAEQPSGVDQDGGNSTQAKGRGGFPKLDELIHFFQTGFDHEKAKQDGVINPRPGVNKAYDAALNDVNSIDDCLQNYLRQQRKRLGTQSITYWGTGRNRYQLEIPDSTLERYTPDDYNLASQKKGFHRYRTEKIESWLEELVRAEELRDEALRDTMRSVFASFDQHFTVWDQAVQCIAALDVLLSLAHYSMHGDGAMCRPVVALSADGHPFVEIREARHPCIAQTFSGDEFISNDTVIGVSDGEDGDGDGDGAGQHSSCLLITGPNMGGKSTLMRQAGIVVILAQLGCYVPAESCHLSPVDRLFTRLGASDHIMSGESTFFVELSETSTILQHATQHSLVLLDELGRGTATFDGTAIASAVVHELTKEIGCRTLFSTHYHSLVDELSGNPAVKLGHMACMVENEDEEDTSKETITFLYKFIAGSCPKSYGFNAARLAGLPDEIIAVGHQKAKDFAHASEKGRLFRALMRSAADKLHTAASGLHKDLRQVACASSA